MSTLPRERHDDLARPGGPESTFSVILACLLGMLAAMAMLPYWLPGLISSVEGPAPKAYWYLSRSSGLVAYALLWQSMVLGLLMTNRLARLWPGDR